MTGEEIKVSVIIPVYNAEKYLRQCLDSVVNQTLKEIEIICVDDGSTDKSLDILREYEAKDSRVRVLVQENQHAGAARNNGMTVARGEYLAFWDADDFFELNALSHSYEKSKKYQADVCLVDADRYDTQTGRFVSTSWSLGRSFIKKQPFSVKDVGENIFRTTTLSPWTKLYSSKFIRKNNISFQTLPRANDVYFTMTSLVLSERIVAVDEVLVHYRIGASDNLQSKNYLSPGVFCDALMAVKQTLTDRGLFQLVAVGFANNALSQCVYNLHKLEDHANEFAFLRTMISEKYADAFGINSLSRKSVFNVSAWDDYQKMMKTKEISATLDGDNPTKCPAEKKRLSSREPPSFIKNTAEHLQNRPPKVSVIIPVYNTELYLQECLDSILGQTLQDIQIICVDDGSHDSSPSILKKYAEKDDRVFLITQRNAGQSAARNAALAIASGEYVYMIDSDDYIDKDALENLYNLCKKQMLDALFFDVERFYDEEALKKCFTTTLTVRKGYESIYSGVELMKRLRKNHQYITSPCLVLLNREFLQSNGIDFFEGIIHEDELFCFYVMMNAQKVSHVSVAYYHRRVRPGSTMTMPKSCKNVIGYFSCAQQMLAYGLSKKWEEEKADQIWYSFNSMINAAKRVYRELSDAEIEKMTVEGALNGFLFDKFVLDKGTVQAQKDRDNNKDTKLIMVQYKCDTLEQEIRNIHMSWTYRIGRLITWLPRKVRGFFRCYQEHGGRYTWHRVFVHLHLCEDEYVISRRKLAIPGVTHTKRVTISSQKSNPVPVKKDYAYYHSLSSDKYPAELCEWYKRRTGQELDLENPKTFNEKIQWLKLYDSTSLKTRLADKYLVRDWVREKIGEQYLVPLLGVWNSFDEIDFNKLPNQFVLKANHGSGWNIIVKDKKKLNREEAKKKFDEWMSKDFALNGGMELHYLNIPPKIIAEQYIEGVDGLYDYKFLCFNGKPCYVWIDVDRYTDHRRNIYDLDWNLQPFTVAYKTTDKAVPPPQKLEEMKRLASVLCKGFAHVRVDFYEVYGRIYFGEMTFTSGNGGEKFTPEEYGEVIGKLITLPLKSPIPQKSF